MPFPANLERPRTLSKPSTLFLRRWALPEALAFEALIRFHKGERAFGFRFRGFLGPGLRLQFR